MGKPITTDEMPLQPQIHLGPFEKWALDFVGPINPPSKGKMFILISTNYVTKWSKVKVLSNETENSIVNLIFENFFVRFGVPREIVIDQGAQFF